MNQKLPPPCLLNTTDWHISPILNGRKRFEEFDVWLIAFTGHRREGNEGLYEGKG